MKQVLMGNEAIALGALAAGVRVVTGYPGTPSTEILETAAKKIAKGEVSAADVYVEWSVNEKAALEVAAGAAWSGLRALVTMKQVGLNVASDPLMSLNYVGVKGGLVLAVADDPGPISSQTEQDTRRFGLYAKVAVFDPSSPEEAMAMVMKAFEVSERYGRPVILRPTTRVCHSYASVEVPPSACDTVSPSDSFRGSGFDRDKARFAIFPNLAYRNHIQIEKDLSGMGDFGPPGSTLVRDVPAAGTAQVAAQKAVLGIASGGVSWAYTLEALDLLRDEAAAGEGAALPPYRLFKAGVFPLPADAAGGFLGGLKDVLVVEELDAVIEDELLKLCGSGGAVPPRIHGKRDGAMPAAGEYSTAMIAEKLRAFLGLPAAAAVPAAGAEEAAKLPVRPPVLCAGCPHRGSFFAVKEAVRLAKRKAAFCGDIGCYTLGNAAPLDMLDTCLCMGAGITAAQGIGRAETLLGHDKADSRVLTFSFTGDSTFFHSGIPGLVNAVYNVADLVAVILDNGTTAMTGGQPHPGIGVGAAGNPAPKLSIQKILEALGLGEDRIRRADPFNLSESLAALGPLLDMDGVRAIIFEGPCISVSRGADVCAVDTSKCTGCRLCITKLGCPAIAPESSGEKPKASIDSSLCTGCGLCAFVCPAAAIARKEAAR